MKPIPLKWIPRIFSWSIIFAVLFGITTTAYAMDKEPVIWVQVPQWQTIHSEKVLTGRLLRGTMQKDYMT